MDLRNVCRTCLRIPEKSMDLFNNNILEKIDCITLIKLEITEGMPNQICEECLTNVNYLYKFRKLLINTITDLRSRLDTLKRTGNKSKPRSNELIRNTLKKEPVTECKVLLPVANNHPIPCDSVITKKIRNKERKCNLPKKYISKCDKCDKTFDDRSKFNHHRAYHNRVLIKGVCTICGAQMLSNNLKRHIEGHSEQLNHCNICGKVLKNASMKDHMLTHSDKISCIICEVCGKEFKIQKNLRRHMKYHSDPAFRKKTCHICGIVVVDTAMKQHMRKHSGERPYICSYCKKGLTSAYALKVHIRLHTNEKPFLCDYCSSAFPQKASLRHHLKKEHGISD